MAEETQRSSAAAPGERGKAVFAQYCSACHGSGGEGGVGPALKNEAAKKNTGQVADFIKNPLSPMPKLYPAPLSDQDIADVTAFVDTLK